MSFYCDYPKHSRQNVFSRNAAGTYFAYLSNRAKCLSYLSDDLSDFDYHNRELSKAMPMGYTGLTILKRAFLMDSIGCHDWSVNHTGELYVLRNEVPKEYWKPETQEYHLHMASFSGPAAAAEAKNYCKAIFDKINQSRVDTGRAILVGAVVVEQYYWH
ncbi:hypothetical protein Elgi_63480 [Paenibacillus elgii]|uniref:hypothetical protein n=1 Tax=Paenibacillus elgii TaxID=189691 RepID=UPI002D7D8291|nr:hypothetical protein Elgi_63480 [Paenibacillus elgii]